MSWNVGKNKKSVGGEGKITFKIGILYKEKNFMSTSNFTGKKKKDFKSYLLVSHYKTAHKNLVAKGKKGSLKFVFKALYYFHFEFSFSIT